MEISSHITNFSHPQRNIPLNQEKPKENPGDKDRVNMSNEALLLTEALRGAQNAPDIREDKVAELKAAIEGGTYNINARLIAERLASEETSLFI